MDVAVKLVVSRARVKKNPAFHARSAWNVAARAARQGAKARMPAHPASGFPPYSWKGRNTRFACAIRTALARTLPLAAFFIDAQFPSLTAQLAVETTQHPNMCPSRIRTPASTTSGTPLRRSLPSRFACHRQAQLAWVNRPHHPLRRPPPQLQTAFHSPNAWSTWRRLFPPHLLTQ